MIYYEVIFEYGTTVTEGYQEIDESIMVEVRLTDLDGNTINFDWSYGYRFKYSPPVKVTPSWA
jgi:hypothetical protein